MISPALCLLCRERTRNFDAVRSITGIAHSLLALAFEELLTRQLKFIRFLLPKLFIDLRIRDVLL